jgi:hypothetical protein
LPQVSIITAATFATEGGVIQQQLASGSLLPHSCPIMVIGEF